MSHFKYNDGGRELAGYKGKTGDCVTRAICIATNKPYQEVYDAIHEANKNFVSSTRKKLKSKTTSPRSGAHKDAYRPYLESLGFKWTPTMKIGSGCTTHLKKEELPSGIIIAKVSKHLVCVVDGIINDTYDCSRAGKRCVYGYYSKT